MGRSLIHDGLRQMQIHGAFFLVVLLVLPWQRLRPAVCGCAVLLFVLFDLVASNLWINPLVRSDFYTPAPVSGYLEQKFQTQGPFRIYRFEPVRVRDHPAILYETDSAVWLSLYRKLTLYPFLAAKDHVQYSVFPSIDRMETLRVQEVIDVVHQAQSTDEKLRALGKLNVRYVLSPTEMASPLLRLDALFQVNSDEPLRIYELRPGLSRAFLVDLEGARGLARRSDRQMEPETDVNGSRGSPVLTSAATEVRFINNSANRVEVEIRANRTQDLVLLDSHFPGWRARVDGRDTEVQLYGDLYRAVRVPAGEHRVTFSYQPQSFRLGLWISCLTAAAWITGLAVFRILRASRRPGSENLPEPGCGQVGMPDRSTS